MKCAQNRMRVIGLFALTLILTGGFSMMNLEKLHAAGTTAASARAKEVKMVNINKAGLEELQGLRGVGPSLAGRILEYRNEKGPFKQIEDLSHVRGIGQAKLEKMRSQISV